METGFDINSLIKGLLQNVPLWSLFLLFAGIIFKKFEKFLRKLEERIDGIEKTLDEIKLDLAASNIQEIPKKLEYLHIAKAELSADMNALWSAIQSISGKSRKPVRDRDS
jgi:hypothetical protein